MDATFIQRVGELRQWSAETGQDLPVPAEAIMALEDAGWVVDLETGKVAGPHWPVALTWQVWAKLFGPKAATNE